MEANEEAKELSGIKGQINDQLKNRVVLEGEYAKKVAESLQISNSLLDDLKESLGIRIRRRTEDSNLLGINRKINQAIQGQVSNLEDVNAVQKQIAKNTQIIEEGTRASENIGKILINDRKEEVNSLIRVIEKQKKFSDLQDDLNKRVSDGNDLDAKGNKITEKRFENLDKILKYGDARIDRGVEELSNLEKQYLFSKLQTDELARRQEVLKDVKDTLQPTDFLSDLLSKIPGVAALSKKAIGDVQKKVIELREKEGEVPKDFSASREYLKNLGKEVFDKLKDPIALLTVALNQIVKQLKEVDKESGNIAKDFNLTYQEALLVRQELVASAAAANELFVVSAGLQETLVAINKTLGTSTFKDFPEGFEQSLYYLTELTKQAGLLDEEMLGIANLVLTTGEDAKVITGEVLAQSELSSLRQGVLINEKEVLRGIKDISAATTLSLQKNPEALAEAVSTAKALGLELSRIEGISDNILQFQSSIESELEAELLIGRNLTLERARFAALNNDVATVTEEIAKNLGSAAEFGRLNRIQQQALAGAVGMSREELGEMLFTQEKLLGLTEKEAARRQQVINKLIQENGLEGAKAIIQQESIERLEHQASVTEDFSALLSQIQEKFVNIAISLAPLGKAIATILQTVTILVNPVTKLVSLFGDMTEEVKYIVSALDTMLSGAGIGALIGTFLLPGLGTAAGAALGAGVTGLGEAYAGGAFNADDLYSEGDGYGERTLLTREGTFRLNDEDNVIAGTDDSLRSIATRSMRPREISTGTTMNVVNSRQFSPISNINTLPVSNIQSNYNTTTTAASNEELVKELRAIKEEMAQNTRENKQNAMFIAKQKATVEYVPTTLGNQFMVNSTDIQYG